VGDEVDAIADSGKRETRCSTQKKAARTIWREEKEKRGEVVRVASSLTRDENGEERTLWQSPRFVASNGWIKVNKRKKT